MKIDKATAERWKKIVVEEYGFDQAEWIPLREPSTMARYDEWLARGWAGEMQYLHRHREQKADPSRLLGPGDATPSSAAASKVARSLLVVTKSYVPAPHPHGEFEALRIASYAQNEDYHDWLRGDLDVIAHRLSLEFPGAHFRTATDSAPVLERDHAVAAGLGWWGKNTCVIHPQRGSFFFIGELVSSLEIDGANVDAHATVATANATAIQPLPDFCGTCDRCLKVCPTGALEAPRQLNATKCISYWTIEAKEIAPEGLREKFGDWFFGCDLCQSVCPWNQKVFRSSPLRPSSPSATAALSTDLLAFAEPGKKSTDMLASAGVPLSASAYDELLIDELRFILTASDADIRAKLKSTALSRAKPAGLRRNALIVIANRRLASLAPDVEMLLRADSPTASAPSATSISQAVAPMPTTPLSSLAAWTLAQLSK